MKVAIVLVLAFASVLALTEQEVKEKFAKAHEKCNSDPATEVKEEDVKKWRKGGGAEPANTGAHSLCISKALGWQDANGKVLKEELKERMSHHVPADQLEKVANECLVDKENEIETAKHLMKCYLEQLKNAHQNH